MSHGCNSTGVIHSVDNGCTAKRHGTEVAYSRYGCRCTAGLAAHARFVRLSSYDRALGRPRRIDATGSRRRIQALIANGWDTDTIAAHLGWSDGQAARRIIRATYIFRSTADRIAELYDRIADQQGPSTRAARYAARQGWLGPLWWDDDTIDAPEDAEVHLRRVPLPDVDSVVVERLTSTNERPPANDAERYAAYCVLRDRGVSPSAVVDKLGLSCKRRTMFSDAYMRDRQEAS